MLQGEHIKATRQCSRSRIFQILALLTFLLTPTVSLAEDDGGGGGGGGAGQALQAVAQAIQGAAPAVEAAIQASADVSIAGTNAAAGVAMSEITAGTSKYLADRQADIANFQAETAEEISKINNDGQTRRLEDQLSELRAAREDALQAEREKLAYEKQLDDEKIALAKKQADDNFKLAQETLNAQLVQAGFSSGFTTFNSGSRLKVTPAFPRLGGPGLASASAFGARSQRLLSSLKTPASSGDSGALQQGIVTGLGGLRASWASSSRTVGGQIAQLMSNHVARGSSPGLHHRLEGISDVPQSDLASFHAAVRTVEREPAALAPEETLRTGGGHHSGGGENAVSTHSGAGSQSDGSGAIQVRRIGR